MTTTPKTLTVTEIHQLLDELLRKAGTAKQSARGVRNYTIACLMVEAGLRVGEVVKMRWCDLYFNWEPVKSIIIPAEIAKNKRERQIPVSARLADALTEYRRVVDTSKLEYLPCFFGLGKRSYEPLTTRQVERFIRKAAEKAIGRPIHPHILRHTFATRLMRVTNSRVVQELLGHDSMTSTQIYMHPNAEDLKEAVDKLNEPEAVGVGGEQSTESGTGVTDRGDTR
ncbi:Tyrosine recombinase XerC [subsurface metagenome]